MRLKHVRIALDQSLLHFLAFFQMLLRVTLRSSPIRDYFYSLHSYSRCRTRRTRSTHSTASNTATSDNYTCASTLKKEKQGNRMNGIVRRSVRAGPCRSARQHTHRRLLFALQTPITATESRSFRRGTRLVLQEKTLYLRHGSRDRPRASASTGPRSAPCRLFLLRCCRPA